MEATIVKNLRKWFWGFFLGQSIIFAIAAIWFSATMSMAVETQGKKIEYIDSKLDLKADLTTVLRIKSDNDRVQQIILEDVKYIRIRIDELGYHNQPAPSYSTAK